MFIVGGLYRVFAAPEERNVAEGESSPTMFRSAGAVVFWFSLVSINIRLLRSLRVLLHLPLLSPLLVRTYSLPTSQPQ